MGITKAFVCFNSERSLHNADIKGKSICLLFSRNVFISIVETLEGLVPVPVGVAAVVVAAAAGVEPVLLGIVVATAAVTPAAGDTPPFERRDDEIFVEVFV